MTPFLKVGRLNASAKTQLEPVHLSFLIEVGGARYPIATAHEGKGGIVVRFHQTEGDEHFTYHSDGTHHQARKIKGGPREHRGRRSRPPIFSIRGWEFVHGQLLFTGYKALCQPDNRNPSYQEIIVRETYHGPRAGICYETYIVSSLDVLAFKEAMTAKRGEKWEEPQIEIVPLQGFPQHSFAIVYNRTPALSSELKGGSLALNGMVLGQELRPRNANPEGAT